MISSTSRDSNLSFVPDLTPLLDIIFIVMVFLLLTANISIQTMNVDIPTTSDTAILQSPPADVIAINILATEPNWAIQKQTFSDWESFNEVLLKQHKANPEHSLVVAIDKDVAVEKMLKLLAFLQHNKINATSIIMEENKL